MTTQVLRNIWKFRGFILGSVRRDFDARYRKSLLGALWSVLAPLGTILIYVVVFTKLMNSRLPGMTGEYAYAIHLCAGIIVWGLFAEIVNRCSSIFIENAGLIKKLNFPRICLPIIAMINALIHFTISMAIFVLALILTGISYPTMSWLYVVPILTIHLLFSASLGVLLGTVNVFFRDVGQFLGLLMHFWFWMTPIVYPLSILPGKIAQIVSWNPMTIIVDAYRAALVPGIVPPLESLLAVFAAAAAIGLLALAWYRRHMDEMVDEL